MLPVAKNLYEHEEIIAAFEAENPNINVEIQVVLWENYWERLQTALAGGDAYDVFWMNGPNFPVYASRGVLMDLQDTVDAGAADTIGSSEQELMLSTAPETLWGVPALWNNLILLSR